MAFPRQIGTKQLFLAGCMHDKRERKKRKSCVSATGAVVRCRRTSHEENILFFFFPAEATAARFSFACFFFVAKGKILFPLMNVDRAGGFHLPLAPTRP